MRTLALATALLLTAAGCSTAEQMVRDAIDTSSSGTTSGSSGGASSSDRWPPAPASGAIDVTGTWDTSWGTMALTQDSDGAVSGTYESGASFIDATNDGNVIRGYWAEPSSSRRCSTARRGTPYWGRVTFVLVARDRWEGRYTYCDATPAYSDASWDGTR